MLLEQKLLLNDRKTTKNEKENVISNKCLQGLWNFPQNQFKLFTTNSIWMSDLQLIVQRNTKVLSKEEKLQRFFNYILDFKLGEQRSYRNRELRCSILRQPNPSTKEAESYTSESSIPNIILSSSSLRLSSSISRSQRKQLVKMQNIKESVNLVHHGYCCDKCYVNPIRGERYHCNVCDYDLCESCFRDGCRLKGQMQRLGDCGGQTLLLSNNYYHEHPLVKIQQRASISSSMKSLLFSGRRQKPLISNQHKSLLRSQKLHKSTK